MFNCDKCEICRVGGRENSFHCDVCEFCFHKDTKPTHKCIPSILKRECPVCMEWMQTSADSLGKMRCGHYIHIKCFHKYMSHNLKCPLCKKSLINPDIIKPYMKNHIESIPMPEEYKHMKMVVLCNDCLQKSTIPFHTVGGKCSKCGSYNTSRIHEDKPEEKKIELQQQNNNTTS